MKIIYITAKVMVDDTHPNAPTKKGCEEAVWNALSTPDYEAFGIKSIDVEAITIKVGTDA